MYVVSTSVRTKVPNIAGTENQLCFYVDGGGKYYFVNTVLKQSPRGAHLEPIELYSCENKALCVVHILCVYLQKTKTLGGKTDNLFLTLLAPHKAASKDTIARLWTLARAGINTAEYTTHSTWSARTSAVRNGDVSMDTIMKAAGWTKAATHKNYYRKMITKRGGRSHINFGQAVRDSYHNRH